jgi:hemoglobin
MTDALCEQAGGVEGLRAVLRTFYDAVYDDVMIGYLFDGIDKERLIAREAELTARLLGDRAVAYTGQPMRAAHARHHILSGHFARRLQLLKQAMEAHGLPAPVRAAWVAHTEALRPQVVTAGSCAQEPAENPPPTE